ncbi:hypothetical protein BHM03_00049167, partial [Ensete ventricosum]
MDRPISCGPCAILGLSHGGNSQNFNRYRLKQVGNDRFRPLSLATGWHQLDCDEGRRSIEGDGRRRRGHLKKREKEDNRENLDAKPFLDPDLASPSLDDPDPRGNGEAVLEQRKRQSPSSPRLRLYSFFFAMIFTEGRRHLRPSTSSPPSLLNAADEAMRRGGN